MILAFVFVYQSPLTPRISPVQDFEQSPGRGESFARGSNVYSASRSEDPQQQQEAEATGAAPLTPPAMTFYVF